MMYCFQPWYRRGPIICLSHKSILSFSGETYNCCVKFVEREHSIHSKWLETHAPCKQKSTKSSPMVLHELVNIRRPKNLILYSFLFLIHLFCHQEVNYIIAVSNLSEEIVAWGILLFTTLIMPILLTVNTFIRVTTQINHNITGVSPD